MKQGQRLPMNRLILRFSLLLVSVTKIWFLVTLLVDSTKAEEEVLEEQSCDAEGGTCSAANSGVPPSTSPSPEEIANLYGVKQLLVGYDSSYLVKVDKYFKDVVFKEAKYRSVRDTCRNQHESCTFWASIGECESNPDYMHLNCAPACLVCNKLIFEERCPFDAEKTPDAWKPGDLNKFFERITTDPYYQQYKPTAVCKPGMPNPHTDDCPWVVTVDDFVSEEECATLIELGAIRGYMRSEDVGERKPDGTYGGKQSEGRTSTNAWCQEDCFNNATVQQVLARIENLTGIPDANSEFLQLLRYDVGQFYEHHHDYIGHHVNRAQGPRILTVFLYLNDVEAGGATHFSDLDISVHPKRGRALIWPSVLDEDPNRMERRTHHQAMPVEKGIKYGANAWIHLRDFKAPYSTSCI